MSEDTQRKVDAEVKKLVDEGYEKAKESLVSGRAMNSLTSLQKLNS